MTNRLQRIVTRVALGFAGLLGLLIVVGFVYGAASSARDARRYPPPGRLVTVGDRQIHIDCRGSGSPVLIFDAGAGGSSADYVDVHERLAAVTSTCFYDRAGLGWSDPMDGVPNGTTIVDDLHGLLQAAGLRPPFVLAGHSFGGYTIRLYQARYPDEVLGLAFIESAHPDQWRDLPPAVGEALNRAVTQLRFAPLLARLGLVRLMQGTPTTANEARSQRPAAIRAARAELIAGRLVADEVAALPPLAPDLPITVVSAGRSFEYFADLGLPLEASAAVWTRLQDDLAMLTTNTRHYVSPDATHAIQYNDPELIVEAVRELLDRVREQNHPGVRTKATTMHQNDAGDETRILRMYLSNARVGSNPTAGTRRAIQTSASHAPGRR